MEDNICVNRKQILMPAPTSILQIEKHTSVEWNFRVSCNFPVYYGQFVEVSLPMIGEAPISVSDFGDGWVDLLIRRVGRVTDALFGLTVGDKLWLRGAYGNGYDLDQFTNRSVLIVAGGTGVAPIKGLLSHLCKHADLVKRLSVILGYKNSESILYKKELASWRENCSLHLTLDEGKAEQDFFSIGRVTDELNNVDFTDADEMQAIVVGPQIMIRSTVDKLNAYGLRNKNIWVDYERRMACSVGKCGHCRIGDIYVCLDGPVFNYSEARLMID